ncbi:MAG: AMP-binding protein [Alistipes sp.]|nr:AMP-binding protein [Alistipes sp.]
MIPNTLYEVFCSAVEKYATKVAFSLWHSADITYGEVERRVREVQQMLVSSGLHAGDKIAILSNNHPNWCVSYFAITTAGYVAVPIMANLTTENIDNILEHSESKALFVSDRLYSKVPKHRLASMNIIIRTKNLKVITQNIAEQGSTALPKPEDLAALLYTSGTTSQPKGVMLSHRSICSQLPMLDSMFCLNEDDVLLSALPLPHSYECTIGFLQPFFHGAKVVYIDRIPTLSVLMPTLKAIRPTIMYTVPLFIEKIYRSEVRKRYTSNIFMRTTYKMRFFRRMLHRNAGIRLSALFGGRLRFFGIGGAKLDPTVERFLVEAGFGYNPLYGLTETAPLIAGVGSGYRLGSTGPALEGIECRLDNLNPKKGVGELVVKTPSCMMGYYKNAEATAEVITEDGWFRTGDLAKIDEDGWIYIKGRVKNMIVGASGENIYPEDIEYVINSHICVTESLVVGRNGGKLVALVVFDKDALQQRFEELNPLWSHKEVSREEMMADLKREIMQSVNASVSTTSRITEIVEEREPFARTGSNKIKRYLYK